MWKRKFSVHKNDQTNSSKLLSDDYRQIIDHVEHCSTCNSSHPEFLSFVEQLPDGEYARTKSAILRHVEKGGLKQRFLDRARAAGIEFSDSLEKQRQTTSLPLFTYRTAMVFGLLALVLVIVGQRIINTPDHFPPERASAPSNHVVQNSPDARNLKLQAKVSELQQATESAQAEIRNLKEENAKMLLEIGALGKDIIGRRNENQSLQKTVAQLQEANAQQESQNEANTLALAHTQSELDEARAQGKNLEAENLSANTEVAALTQQLSTKQKSLAHDRELLAAGRDITDLMGARSLHIIDVRDSDGKGKNKDSFGRIFYTEGKSLIFYAYDLDQEKVTKANYTFEVWGERLGEPTSIRNLGILFTDNKEQKRWALRVDDPQQLSEIDSVFVTLESHQGETKPLGGKILFAFLGGKANHP